MSNAAACEPPSPPVPLCCSDGIVAISPTAAWVSPAPFCRAFLEPLSPHAEEEASKDLSALLAASKGKHE